MGMNTDVAKELHNEHDLECDPGICGRRTCRSNRFISNASVLLVRAARILGEPVDYLVPLTLAGLFLFGFMISLARLPRQMLDLPSYDPVHQRSILAMPYEFSSGLMMLAVILSQRVLLRGRAAE